MSVIHPTHYPWLDYRRYSFSLGRSVAGMAFLSGATASTFDPQARRVEIRGGMAEQAGTAFDKIEATLVAAGLTPGDVTRLTEYLPPEGIARYDELREVRDARLGGGTPAVVTVPVRRLMREGALVEIEVLAGAPDPTASAGLIHLPTIRPVDRAGDVVHPGDIVGQTAHILDTAESMLRALGSDLSHVVMTVDCITEAARHDYKASGAVRRERLGPVYPGAAGIVQPQLMHPESLVQYNITASRDVPVRVDPGWRRYDALSYSAAVRAGRMVFLSGMGALDPDSLTFRHPDDVAAQADYVFELTRLAMEAAGGSISDIVEQVEFVAPDAVARYRDVAAIRRRHFGERYPAATGVCCGGLLRRDMRIEILQTAVLGAGDSP